jgi:hypothetical protein
VVIITAEFYGNGNYADLSGWLSAWIRRRARVVFFVRAAWTLRNINALLDRIEWTGSG